MNNNFYTCMNAVVPTLILMLVGYIGKKCHIIERENVFKFNKTLFYSFLPVMMFNNVYNSDIKAAFNPKLIIYIIIGLILEILCSVLIAKKAANQPNRIGVMIQGMYRSNTAIVGLAVASDLLGNADLGPIVVSIVFGIPIFNISAVIVLKVFGGKITDPKKVIKDIVTNPLIIATILSVAIKLSGIVIPHTILAAVKNMANACSPIMLFLIGAFFSIENIRDSIKELIISTSFKLLVFPAVFLLLGMLLGFRGVEFVAIITIFATSNAITSFTMAQQLGGDADLAGNIVVMTNALCPFTLFLWCFIFKSLGVF